MNCAKCGQSNAGDARFCNGCGQALALACSQCGRENAPGSRFCNGCGRNLSAPDTQPSDAPQTDAPARLAAQPEGERRQATVLFSDLSGYTAMNERLDPEEVEVLERGLAGGKAYRLEAWG